MTRWLLCLLLAACFASSRAEEDNKLRREQHCTICKAAAGSIWQQKAKAVEERNPNAGLNLGAICEIVMDRWKVVMDHWSQIPEATQINYARLWAPTREAMPPVVAAACRDWLNDNFDRMADHLRRTMKDKVPDQATPFQEALCFNVCDEYEFAAPKKKKSSASGGKKKDL